MDVEKVNDSLAAGIKATGGEGEERGEEKDSPSDPGGGRPLGPLLGGPATTAEQRSILKHALGLEGSFKHRHPYRNYYCAEVGGEDDAEITRLVEMGLMRKGPTINDGRDYYAFVTEAGKAEVVG
jgi:hypothetical protein